MGVSMQPCMHAQWWQIGSVCLLFMYSYSVKYIEKLESLENNDFKISEKYDFKIKIMPNSVCN